MLNAGQCATLACLLEVTACKPGNVHRGADFDDMTFADFAASAVAIAPAMEAAPRRALGQTILTAIQATRAVTQANTNLGIVLLFAPLAAAGSDLKNGVADVLAKLDENDAIDVYEAIRLTSPGGLGQRDEMDVHQPPPKDLLEAMRHAAAYDSVAGQYARNFEDVFEQIVPRLIHATASLDLLRAVVHVHVQTMAATADSLIARKCGDELARLSATRAQRVIDAGEPFGDAYLAELSELDFWLRSDGNRRNPGTTADLVAAGLFVLLLNGELPLPLS